MRSAVLARAMLSVCLSVTLRYCVQTNEATIVRFSAYGRKIPLVSGEVKFIRIFAVCVISPNSVANFVANYVKVVD